MKKTILYYNWNTLNSASGGGVNVYQKNIINNIKNSDFNIVFLSSGVLYDNSNRIYIKSIDNNFGIKEYTIVNSPVLAPAKQSAKNYKNYLEDTELAEIFYEFCRNIKNLSVIHFNNLEGLSINCLKIKSKIKNIKVIYSAHNYFSICPEVNLWYKEQKNCYNNNCKDCAHCFKYQPRKMQIKKRIALTKINKPVIKKIATKFIHLLYIFSKKEVYKTNYYELFIKNNIEYINKYVDCVLAVSKRVEEILISSGIDKKIVHLSYIGNDFSSMNPKKCCADTDSNIFKIIYLGPMRTDKGFYFLIDALTKIPLEYSKNIEVTLAAKYKDRNALRKIRKIKKNYSNIYTMNGYKRNELNEILKDKNLGIVPILWEDNLPQVAIEMVACGVPILCGNFGGAKEIASNNSFVFKSGSYEDFEQKLINIYNNRNLLKNYYKKKPKLVTIEEHINELINIYNS